MNLRAFFLTGVIGCMSLSPSLFGQEEADSKDRNFRLEVEPASFVLRGFSGSISYNVTKDNNLSLGLYSASLDVPEWARPDMFENVGDTSTVRLGFEAALMARYRFALFPQWESNPYVGLIAGWEYFDIAQPYQLAEKVRLSTIVLTPYVGYEIYFFRQMLYVNPQLRAVLYLGSSTSNELRPERMGTFFLLPQISLGVRF